MSKVLRFSVLVATLCGVATVSLAQNASRNHAPQKKNAAARPVERGLGVLDEKQEMEALDASLKQLYEITNGRVVPDSMPGIGERTPPKSMDEMIPQ